MHRRARLGWLGLVLIMSWWTTMPAHAAEQRCFPETRQCMSGRFAVYWQQQGSLPVFGFPITSATGELNRDTRVVYLTQWFERNRFELHPENQAPYDVLLGRLGDDRLRQMGVDWQTLPKAAPSESHYFSASGQAIAHAPFWRYWSTHGLELGDPGVSERESLALFGLPISPPRTETNSSGDTVLTQWFERARFEDHGPKGVLLGLLGNEVQASIAPGTGPIAIPEPQPLPPTPPTPPEPLPPSFDNCRTDNRVFLSPNYPVQIIAVDKLAEVVTLRNVSSQPVNLDGWRMCSVRDSQEHGGIGGTLQPGEIRSFQGPGGNIWDDQQRDDGALYDAQGSLISFYGDRAN